MSALLEINDLKVQFNTPRGIVTAVDGISFEIRKGDILCIVGESGCGKSVTALSILQLLADSGRYAGGSIHFNGRNVLELSNKEITKIRGNDISMIFQEPMTSLNPVHEIQDQIGESFEIHAKETKQNAHKRAVEMLKLVGVPDADRVARNYPHQLSGGMRQRAMIAMAMACQPQLLIADEPTTALDVTIQAQILQLLKRMQKEEDVAIMFITHDLGVVAEIATYILVMYAGKIVEEGTPEDIFYRPKHPYTEGLLRCIPRVDKDLDMLETIEGQVPNPTNFPPGCRFHNRCKYCQEICTVEVPQLKKIDGRTYACHFIPEARKERRDD